MVNDQNKFIALGTFEETAGNAETLSQLVYVVLENQFQDMLRYVLERIKSIGSDQARTQLKTNKLLIKRFKEVYCPLIYLIY